MVQANELAQQILALEDEIKGLIEDECRLVNMRAFSEVKEVQNDLSIARRQLFQLQSTH